MKTTIRFVLGVASVVLTEPVACSCRTQQSQGYVLRLCETVSKGLSKTTSLRFNAVRSFKRERGGKGEGNEQNNGMLTGKVEVDFYERGEKSAKK